MVRFFVFLLIAVLFAIPTYGLSLLAFFCIKWAMDQYGVGKLSGASQISIRNDKPVKVADISNASIRTFFGRYGSTQGKVERYEAPVTFYVGYVRMGSNEEVLATITRDGDGVIVSTLATPYQFGDDMMSILGRKAYADQIVSLMRASK